MTEKIFPYELPENWRWRKVGTVIKLISGRDVSPSRCNGEKSGMPYVIGASNFNSNKFYAERWIEIPEVTSEKNDILISVKGTIGKIYFQIEEKLNISRQIMAIRPISNMCQKYFFCFFIFMSEKIKLSGNGLIPGISRSTILEIPIPLPPLDEQKKLSSVSKVYFQSWTRQKPSFKKF